MSAPLILPPTGARACFWCSAWRPWGHQTVGRDAEGAKGFTVLGRQPLGQCRAAPPTIDARELSDANAAWPVVLSDDWCRIFDPKNDIEQRPGAPRNESGSPAR